MEIHNQWFVFYVAPMLLNFVAIIWTIFEFNYPEVQQLIRANQKEFEEEYGPVKAFYPFMVFCSVVAVIPLFNLVLFCYFAFVAISVIISTIKGILSK